MTESPSPVNFRALDARSRFAPSAPSPVRRAVHGLDINSGRISFATAPGAGSPGIVSASTGSGSLTVLPHVESEGDSASQELIRLHKDMVDGVRAATIAEQRAADVIERIRTPSGLGAPCSLQGDACFADVGSVLGQELLVASRSATERRFVGSQQPVQLEGRSTGSRSTLRLQELDAAGTRPSILAVGAPSCGLERVGASDVVELQLLD